MNLSSDEEPVKKLRKHYHTAYKGSTQAQEVVLSSDNEETVEPQLRTKKTKKPSLSCYSVKGSPQEVVLSSDEEEARLPSKKVQKSIPSFKDSTNGKFDIFLIFMK